MSGPPRTPGGVGGRRSPNVGSVVLITGAAGGIGSALARRWAREGAHTVLVDLNGEGVEALARALTRAGNEALAVACDVTDPEACREAVAAATEAFGGVDVVVNNAGRTHLGTVEETDAEVFRAVMEVNFFGALNMTRAALPSLRSRRGAVAVLSSVAGFAPLSGRAGYAASKHALHGLFDSLRGEVRADGVGVTLVCPAFTRTAIGRSALGPDGAPATAERTETGRLLDPEEVADAVVRGVARRRRLVLVGATSRVAYWVSRLAPGLYERLMVRRLLRR